MFVVLDCNLQTGRAARHLRRRPAVRGAAERAGRAEAGHGGVVAVAQGAALYIYIYRERERDR